MSDNISLVETDQVYEKIQKILRQTDYTEENAIMKLKDYNYDEIAVIKSYLGITEKKAPTQPALSVNQEIYRQMRYKLDSNMRDYQVRVDRGNVKKVV